MISRCQIDILIVGEARRRIEQHKLDDQKTETGSISKTSRKREFVEIADTNFDATCWHFCVLGTF